MPFSDHAVLLKATVQHGRLSTAVLCHGLEKNGMVREWHGRGTAWQGNVMGAAWARHAMRESPVILSTYYYHRDLRSSFRRRLFNVPDARRTARHWQSVGRSVWPALIDQAEK